MTQDLICINDKFAPDVLAFYEKHGIVTPIQDVMYSARSISKNSMGNWEILLNEIVNKEIPIKHPVLGVSYKEPAWDLKKRFANIDQSEISEEDVNELKKNKKKEIVLIPVKRKKDEEERIQ